MKTFHINGHDIEIDDTVEYMDFWLENGSPKLAAIDMARFMKFVEDGKVPVDKEFFDHFRWLDRWIYEAPRKRFYRGLKQSGISVLSGEHFFENEPEGDKWIDALENTGKVARKVLETFGEKVSERIPDDQDAQ